MNVKIELIETYYLFLNAYPKKITYKISNIFKKFDNNGQCAKKNRIIVHSLLGIVHFIHPRDNQWVSDCYSIANFSPSKGIMELK